MPVGYQCWNEGGVLQIDGVYRNLRFLSKWTASSYQSSRFQMLSAALMQEIDVTFNSSVPLLAIRCDYPIALIHLSHNGTAASYKFFIYNQTSVPVTFYAFGPQDFSGSNFGLQIFDGNSVLVFDAMNRPLRITSQIISPGANNTYPYPSGRAYAMIISELIGYVVAPNTFPLDPLDFYTRFVRNSGNDIVAQEIKHYGNPAWSIVANQIYDNRAGRVLIVDVTGY